MTSPAKTFFQVMLIRFTLYTVAYLLLYLPEILEGRILLQQNFLAPWSRIMSILTDGVNFMTFLSKYKTTRFFQLVHLAPVFCSMLENLAFELQTETV